MQIIQSAMASWTAATCIKFKVRSSESDYVLFRSDDTGGCFSDSIGRDGGEQVINLFPKNATSLNCETTGTYLTHRHFFMGVV